MNVTRLFPAGLAGVVLLGSIGGIRTASSANTASTVAIAAGAAAIVGALLYDSSNHPYYVRNNHRYYVTQPEAQMYRAHHHGQMRRAYVPEQEYPEARDPYHGNMANHGNMGHNR